MYRGREYTSGGRGRAAGAASRRRALPTRDRAERVRRGAATRSRRPAPGAGGCGSRAAPSGTWHPAAPRVARRAALPGGAAAAGRRRPSRPSLARASESRRRGASAAQRRRPRRATGRRAACGASLSVSQRGGETPFTPRRLGELTAAAQAEADVQQHLAQRAASVPTARCLEQSVKAEPAAVGVEVGVEDLLRGQQRHQEVVCEEGGPGRADRVLARVVLRRATRRGH
mmetsp:Transcript_13669/g.39202  ORF Transcript_13669/g.39202 Transcript_13669/m.39202 type:complete len:229 (-) Transcript_13669:19-705(-)